MATYVEWSSRIDIMISESDTGCNMNERGEKHRIHRAGANYHYMRMKKKILRKLQLGERMFAGDGESG